MLFNSHLEWCYECKGIFCYSCIYRCDLESSLSFASLFYHFYQVSGQLSTIFQVLWSSIQKTYSLQMQVNVCQSFSELCNSTAVPKCVNHEKQLISAWKPACLIQPILAQGCPFFHSENTFIFFQLELVWTYKGENIIKNVWISHTFFFSFHFFDSLLVSHSLSLSHTLRPLISWHFTALHIHNDCGRYFGLTQ